MAIGERKENWNSCSGFTILVTGFYTCCESREKGKEAIHFTHL